MTDREIGKIEKEIGAFPSATEMATADFLASMGYTVLFLKPNRARGAKTPDIIMSDKRWEIKNPRGKSSRTIENNLRLAILQSPYIILDLRHMDGRIPTHKLLREAERRFHDSKKISHLILITREQKSIDFRR